MADLEQLRRVLTEQLEDIDQELGTLEQLLGSGAWRGVLRREGERRQGHLRRRRSTLKGLLEDVDRPAVPPTVTSSP